jgi:hypothetical protein
LVSAALVPVTLQVPAAMKVTLDPDTVQTESVVLAKLTAPDPDPPLVVKGETRFGNW